MAGQSVHGICVAGALLLCCGGMAMHDACASDAEWYVGVADLNNAKVRGSLDARRLSPGVVSASTALDSSDTGYRVFGGYQLNRIFAVEAGYAVLGDFSFAMATVPAGTLRGDIEVAAASADAVATLPLPYRFALLGRAGLARSVTETSVAGSGAAAVTRGRFRESAWGYHVGLGAAYDVTSVVSLRAEWERYRVADGMGGRANVDLLALGVRARF